MTKSQHFDIHINEDENEIVEVSISMSQDFKIDMEFSEIVKKLEEVFE